MVEQVQPLTEDQRTFVAENHNLIFSFANSRRIDLDEFYGLLAIGLCRAAQGFDESKGCSFSTYLYSVLDSIYKNYWRNEYSSSTIPSYALMSLNEHADKQNGTDSSELLELLDDPAYVTETDTTSAEIREFCQSLSEKEQKVLACLMNGYTEHEIGRHLGVTHQYVNQVKIRIARKYYIFTENLDLASKKKPMKTIRKKYFEKLRSPRK